MSVLDLDHVPQLDPLGARLQLEAAVDQLTRPGSERIATDDPEKPWRHAPVLPLLAVAEDAVGAATATGGSRATGSRSPGRLAAIVLLIEVDEAIGHQPGARDRSRAARLRAWAADMHGADPETLAWAVVVAERWVDRCRGLTEPVWTIPVRGIACPSCGHSSVLVEGGEGEDVVAPALLVDMRYGEVACGVAGCETRWRIEQYAGLAAHLGRQTAHEVLAEG